LRGIHTFTQTKGKKKKKKKQSQFPPARWPRPKEAWKDLRLAIGGRLVFVCLLKLNSRQRGVAADARRHTHGQSQHRAMFILNW
jgi:hypothetical protein